MKRDMDLIRKILLSIQDDDDSEGYHETPSLNGYSYEEVAYHCRLMDEAGLIEYSGWQDGAGIISRITWNGHEFISLSSNSTVWEKTKKTLLEKGIDFTFDIGIKLLTRFRDELLGM